MTTIDPFTTPAEAERAARAKQAQDLLALAAGVKHVVTSSYDGKAYRYNYADGVEAMRDALVGQGYALLTVRDELADIAASLRTLAAMPSAIARVAESLTELGVDARDVHTAIEESGQNTAAAIREHAETVNDALGNVAEVIDRARWWQLRRRWTMRRHRKALDFYAGRGSVAESEADVYDYRVELRWPGKSLEPTVSERFLAKSATACDVAREWLPLLCERAHVPAEPDEVYGQVFLVLQDGTAIGYIDAVFLPGAAVLDYVPTE